MRYAYAALLAVAMACQQPATGITVASLRSTPAAEVPLLRPGVSESFTMWIAPVICLDGDVSCKPRLDEWVRQHDQGYTVLARLGPTPDPINDPAAYVKPNFTCHAEDHVCIDWRASSTPLVLILL